MPVIVSCTDLFLYFLYLFSNFIQLVPILFTPVQLCTFLNFFGKFLYVYDFTGFFVCIERLLNPKLSITLLLCNKI